MSTQTNGGLTRYILDLVESEDNGITSDSYSINLPSYL